jgi:arylsulfatase A-like enzyme
MKRKSQSPDKKLSRRKLLKLGLGLGVSGATALVVSQLLGPKKKRPNILFIMADDMPPGDLSCYYNQEFQTPNIDRLAKEGVLFTDAYSATPNCRPTRCAFMTGSYPQKFEIGNRGSADIENEPVRLPEANLTTVLEDLGYENVLVGKWHLGRPKGSHPLDNGFHEYFGILGASVDYFSHRNVGRSPPLLTEERQRVDKKGYVTDLFTEKAIEVLSRPREKPLFLSLQYTAPHVPIEGPSDEGKSSALWKEADKLSALAFAEKYEHFGSRASYIEVIKRLDESIGKILTTLREKNLENDTLVILTSDNGGTTHGNLHHFRGGKATIWEGGIRVPTLMKWPARVEKGLALNFPVITMDLTATILSAANFGDSSNLVHDGTDLLPCLGSKTLQNKLMERKLFWRWRGSRSVRKGNWKFLRDDSGQEHLFDVLKNPQETEDLSANEPKIMEALKTDLQNWEAQLLPAPAPNDPTFFDFPKKLKEEV